MGGFVMMILCVTLTLCVTSVRADARFELCHHRDAGLGCPVVRCEV